MWRRQQARNLMDCYALAMEGLGGMWGKGAAAHKALESLMRLMVMGMTALRDEEDEKVFYRMAAGLCRECAAACRERREAGLFGVYAAIFEETSGKGGAT